MNSSAEIISITQMRSDHHLLVLGVTCLLTALFALQQNRRDWIGGAISLPKVLWLNYTLIVFFALPYCLWGNASLSRSVRSLFGLALASFIIRAVIELYLLYFTRSWKCIYGICHDWITFFLVLFVWCQLPGDYSSIDRRSLVFTSIFLITLVAESWMAWQFSRIASPRDGIYFASNSARFRFINSASAIIVATLYPPLIYFLWLTRGDFQRS